MSYILDALRKSEQERRQAEPAVPLVEAPRALLPPRRDIGAPMTALAVAAAVVVLAGAWWMFNLNLQSPPFAGLRGATAPTEVPGARAAPDASETAAQSSATATAPDAAAPATALAMATPAPKLQPSPFVPAARGSGRDLAEEARVDPPTVRSRAAPAVPAPTPSRSPVAEPAPPPVQAPVKFLYAMPDEFRSALPPLEVTIHIYAPRAADRILYINNRQYQAGDRVGEGIRLERIVEDGAVLSYRGQSFKLPRPS